LMPRRIVIVAARWRFSIRLRAVCRSSGAYANRHLGLLQNAYACG
jgi:hypothetical protein